MMAVSNIKLTQICLVLIIIACIEITESLPMSASLVNRANLRRPFKKLIVNRSALKLSILNELFEILKKNNLQLKNSSTIGVRNRIFTFKATKTNRTTTKTCYARINLDNPETPLIECWP